MAILDNIFLDLICIFYYQQFRSNFMIWHHNMKAREEISLIPNVSNQNLQIQTQKISQVTFHFNITLIPSKPRFTLNGKHNLFPT